MSNNTLVVYYSLTGNAKFIAETIKEAIAADVLAIKPVKELDPEKGSRFFWGGYQATMKMKPKLVPFDINPLNYDLIIMGTPVWAWNFTPPIRSFINKFNLSGKKVAIWSCSDGGTEKAIIKLKSELKGANIIGALNLQTPLRKPEESKKKAIEWAQKMITL